MIEAPDCASDIEQSDDRLVTIDDTELFGSEAKEGKWHHDAKNSLLSAESIEGGEEIEDDESSTWLDHVQTSSAAAMVTNADFDVESEVDLSADGLLAVLAESRPNVDSTGKGKAEAEDINGSDDECPEVWE
ncbi:uncharacterized protein F5891DRAFT_987281 [Suillus fuscotomentosus]|uniref:Uncharacterized protein n=1 Tax=Suillus fuscotomentosus TaxID=1912939 RepID=A0AAD4DQF1_9AGAM|nr:uncharacterized protein F5891DRAFT_987281 [Suillus fuscotomentosus]KAG1889692.1 hypothetical protein F5891DRAFT_987281 [Suillus fuscotomentosus]